MEEIIYITPNGGEFSEIILREKYGERFDKLLADGIFKKKSDMDSISEDGSSEQVQVEETVAQGDPNNLEVLQKDLVFPAESEEPQQINVVNEIPEVVEEKEVEVTPEETAAQRLFLEDKGVDVDAILRERKFGNKETLGTEAKDIALEYDTYLTNNASKTIKTDLSSPKLKPIERELEEDKEVKTTLINKNILDELKIDVEDYSKWEQNTQREESASFKFIKEAFATDEGEVFNKEKKDTEKILSYKMEVMNGLKEDIATIDSRLQLAQDPKDQLQLLNVKKQLEAKLIEESNTLNKMGSMFPKYKELTYDLDLQRRKNIYAAGQTDVTFNLPGSTVPVPINIKLFTELGETAKTIPSTITNFALGSGAAIFSLVDQVLTGVGADKKGVLAGVTEALLDTSEALDIEIGPVKRSGVTEGKNVTVSGKEYVVTDEGDVLDAITNVSMVGIISEDKFEEIKKRAKNVKFSETNYSGGSIVQGGIQTMANLFALIKGGQRLSKALGVSGGTGMGLASYASTSAQSVEDMRSDLIKAGLTEDEALTKAAIAGNTIATLDGFFSGLAGSNTKVLSSLQGIKKSIIDLVKKDGKKFTADKLKTKTIDLAVENFSELTIEELPVLLSEKAINEVVNKITGLSVRSSKVKVSEIMETVIMTLGATTTLGSKNLLSGNKRSDALRYVARNVNDLDNSVKILVAQSHLTPVEGKTVYDEVYAMQVAENRTKGTIVDSDNMLEMSDLINQRKRLVEQRDGLEGPLKEEQDQRIADVDEQIRTVKDRDNKEAKKEVSPTEKEVKDSLAAKGVDNPTSEQITEESNLIINGKNKVVESETIEETEDKKTNLVKKEEEVSNELDQQDDLEVSESTEVIIEEGKPLTVNENKQMFVSVRDPKTPKQKRRKAFLNIISNIKTKGKVATRTAKALMKEIENLNFNNPVTVERAIQKITKTFDKANKTKELEVANETKSKITRAAGVDKLDPNVSAAAKEFLKIDPLMVDDLAKYQQEATKLLKGLNPTRRTKTGINVAPAVDIKSTEEYSVKENVAQEKREAQIQADAFESLTGVPPGDLSLSEVREIIEALDTKDENKKKEAAPSEKKSKVIFDALKNAFSIYTAVVDSQLKNQKDPFTGEKIEISDKDKQLVRAFMNMDLNVLTDQEALQALDSLINFATNSSTGGMGKVVNLYVGKTNLVKAIKDGLKGISLYDAGNFFSQKISSVPLMLEMIFKGQSRAAKFLALSGFQDVINGSAKAETQTNKIEEIFVKKFENSKPNGEAFNTSLNMTERGMFAFMRRTLIGTEAEQQQEFDRKKGLILESIQKLKSTKNKTDNEKAEFYQEVFDKILKDSNDITDVESKVAKTNFEAVEWMTDEWKKHYKDLSDTNLNIYNKKLDQDINYTPDVFSLLEPDTSQQRIDEPMFDTSGRRIYNKETGVLKKSKRPKSLDDTRYVNLSFDTSNISSLRKALTDINTAAAIQQVKGFTESGDFDKLIPKKADRDIVYNRMKDYIAKKRGLDYTPQSAKKVLKYLNTLTSLGVSRTLGSIGQFPKQLTPLFNTMVNAGGVNTIGGIRLFTKPSVINWLKDSGYDIANRGISASANLESLSRKVDEAANSKPEKIRRLFQNTQNWWIDKLLVAPDKIAANASWMAYYVREMKKQGIDVTDPGFDWENHKVNKKAGDYAQQQVDRQQNISDRDLQGQLFSSNNPYATLTRQVLLPFSNFLLNQKARMYSDGRTLVSKTATKEDKTAALRSIGGLVVETAAFNGLGLLLTQLTAAASNYLMGEDDEEQAAKDFDNRIKGRMQNVLLDVINPAPPADDLVIRAINGVIKMIDDGEDPFQFFESNKKLIEDLGLISISADKVYELYDFANVMASGEYKKENAFGGSKTHKLSKDEKKAAQYSTLLLTFYTLGALPAEAGSIARYNMRTIKRNASKSTKYLSVKNQKRLRIENPVKWNKTYGPKSFYYRDKKRKAETRKRNK